MIGIGARLVELAREEERERCAKIAENFYTGIIRCKDGGNIEHLRMHVEYQWAHAVAAAIREAP